MIKRITALQPELKFMTPIWSHAARLAAVRHFDARDRVLATGDAVPYSVQDARWCVDPYPSADGEDGGSGSDRRSAPEISASGIFLGYTNTPPTGYHADTARYSVRRPFIARCMHSFTHSLTRSFIHCVVLHELQGTWVNPYDPSLTSVGSCGSSGLAVATRCSYFTIGVDSIGSVRYSAAANGVFGVVPARGDPVFATSRRIRPGVIRPGVIRPGVLTRSIRDAAIVCGDFYADQLARNTTQPLRARHTHCYTHCYTHCPCA